MFTIVLANVCFPQNPQKVASALNITERSDITLMSGARECNELNFAMENGLEILGCPYS